jgi:hypothetical protein
MTSKLVFPWAVRTIDINKVTKKARGPFAVTPRGRHPGLPGYRTVEFTVAVDDPDDGDIEGFVSDLEDHLNDALVFFTPAPHRLE